MTINSELPTLPKKGIIFLDNCIFSQEHDDPRGNKKRHYTVKNLKQGIIRLDYLKENLSILDNWCTIQEVLEEFKEGQVSLRYEIRVSRSNQTKKLLEKILIKREGLFELLNQRHRIANNNLVHKLSDIINKITPRIERTFMEKEGKTNKKKTDIKLISLALAYAKQDSSYLFSQDKPLLKTFADCADKLYLSDNTYFISYEFKTPIPTQKYFVAQARQSEI